MVVVIVAVVDIGDSSGIVVAAVVVGHQYIVIVGAHVLLDALAGEQPPRHLQDQVEPEHMQALQCHLHTYIHTYMRYIHAVHIFSKYSVK